MSACKIECANICIIKSKISCNFLWRKWVGRDSIISLSETFEFANNGSSCVLRNLLKRFIEFFSFSYWIPLKYQHSKIKFEVTDLEERKDKLNINLKTSLWKLFIWILSSRPPPPCKWRKFVSIEDCVESLMKRLENYIKQRDEKLIIPAENFNETCMQRKKKRSKKH